MTLWSGRVGTGLAPEVEALLRADDAELFFYDIEATRTHAKRLVAACKPFDPAVLEWMHPARNCPGTLQ